MIKIKSRKKVKENESENKSVSSLECTTPNNNNFHIFTLLEETSYISIIHPDL